MRPLLILSEPRHSQRVAEIIQKYAHPVAAERFIRQIAIDLEVESESRKIHHSILQVLLNEQPSGAQQDYLVCASHDIEREFKLRSFLKTQHVEFEFYNASELKAPLDAGGKKKPQLATLLNTCGLSVLGTASSLLAQWAHSQVDLGSITAWKNQFGNLGKFYWIADLILANVKLTSPPELSELLVSSPVRQADAVAYNKDKRAVKSGEVIANLLTKRDSNLKIFSSPAEAIESFPAGQIVMVEDGLWSGTEAIGVLESLLGKRPPEREKTARLVNPQLLYSANLTFAYGVGTDYGQAMVTRYLADEGLGNIRVFCGSSLPVAAPGLLEQIADPSFSAASLREAGPESGKLTPYLQGCLASLTSTQQRDAMAFCRSIGGQLLRNYLEDQVRDKGWDMWEQERIAKCSLGMHGLGLAHVFGHSVPKATLPLLWGRGKVVLNGKSVDWIPLFQNS